MRNLSNSSAPKKARLRDFRADLTSSEVRVSSESVSMEPNKSRIDISSSFIQVERAVMRSSMTKWTPQSGHVLLSMGIKEPQAPHSPISSCATPENETPHFGHDFESKGIIALQVIRHIQPFRHYHRNSRRQSSSPHRLNHSWDTI